MQYAISEFPSAPLSKRVQVQNFSHGNCFQFQWDRKLIFMTNFALSLALKWRLRWTRKWPIVNVFHSHWLIRSNFRLRWSDNIWVNLVLLYTTYDPIFIYESSVSSGDRTQRIGRKKKVKEFKRVNPFIMKMPVFTVRNKCKIHSEVFSLKIFCKKAFWNI